MASFASLLVPGVNIPAPDHSWIGGAADSIVGGIDKFKQNRSFNKLADLIGQQPQAGAVQPGAIAPGITQRQPPQTMAAPVTGVDRSAPQGDVYKPFIETVKTKITNPYGLAAVAATGRAESRYSPENVNRTWSDPSESGQAGTSGGILSWRGPRLANLQAYAASKGEQGNGSPQTQGEFLLQENPQLIAQLNTASSPEEAAGMMANAWKFAGHDRQGGEAARRQALAKNYYAQEFANQPAGAAAAIDAQAPGGMGSPMTDQAFDGRFGDTALPGQVAQGMGGLASALTESNAAGAMPQQAAQPAAQPAALPIQTQQQPNQVANASGQPFAGVPGVQPVPRGGVPVSLIQTMLRDPNLREVGLQLWAQNVQGPKATEPFQFVTLPDGTFARANQQTGEVVPVGNFAKNPNADLPNSYREYQLAKQDGFGGTYEQWEKQKTPGGIGVTVNNIPGEGETAKAAGKGLGELFSGMFNDGLNSRSDLASIGLLRSSIAQSPSGFLGAAAGIASDFGVNVGPNSDQVQVAKSIIAKLVPTQRVPGSGTTSDRDLALFQDSLPRLSGTPEGNQIILDTMQALAENKAAQGAIVSDYYAGGPGNDQASTIKKLRELPDPFAGFKRLNGGSENAPASGSTGRRATNPQTGEVIELRNGKWVPVDGR